MAYGSVKANTLTYNVGSGDVDLAISTISSSSNLNLKADKASPTFTGAVQNNATVTVGVNDTGYDVKFFGATAGSFWQWDESADGVVQIGTLTVGVDDAGHDVKFFGDTASAYCLWDASTDDIKLAGVGGLIVEGTGEVVVPDGQFKLGSTAVTSSAAEINTLDGVTAGTVSASKAIIVDANKDLTGLNDVTIAGDLTVNGTTTTINSTTLQVDDKNIELGTVSTPSDTTADGGGITLKGGASDKTITWVNSTDSWDFNQSVKVTGTGAFTERVNVGSGTLANIGLAAYNDSTTASQPTLYAENDQTSGNLFLGYGAGALKATITGTGAATFAGAVADGKGDVRKIIQNTQGSTYTLVAADAGKHILASGTVTIPNNIFSAGDAVTIVNNTASNLTLTRSITNMYMSADGTDAASRTLATRGMATILFVSGTAAYISGAGLT
jgi:hypothetical protein